MPTLRSGKGLLRNKLAHGQEWEREGSVSYFEDGRLIFASGVGVRIHGGGSRITAPRPGFRLYFRRKYGPREAPPGVFFSPAAQPVRRIIVHDDVRRFGKLDWHFANPLAYDIARAIGAIAPETKPVRFFLNGEYYGPFVLTERFDERYFAAHWGYDDILLARMNDPPGTGADDRRSHGQRSQKVNIAILRAVRGVGLRRRNAYTSRTVSRPDQDTWLFLGELGHGSELPGLESR